MNEEDQELSAMTAVLGALQALDAPAKTRVLRWAWERFGEGPQLGLDGLEARGGPTERAQADVADVVHQTGASNGPERCLAVAYWLQEIGRRPDWAAQEVNNALKNLGHPVANITKTLDSLRAQRPSLVMQVSKSGRAQQARKTYKLTAAGVERVRAMLAQSGDSEAAA